MAGLYTKAKELREKREKIWKDQKAIHAKATEESRDLNEDEQRKWDDAEAEYQKVDSEIQTVETELERFNERAEKLGARAEDLSSLTNHISTDQVEEEAEANQVRYSDAFRAWCAGGLGELSPEERQALKSREGKFEGRTMRGNGHLDINANWGEMAEKRAQSVGTDTAGGHTVDTTLAGRIQTALLQFGGMRQARTTKITTETGEDLIIPTSDDTGNTGEIIAENAQHNEQDVAFAATTLQSYMYSSKIIRVSLQLLQDSAFPIEAYLGDRLGERIGRIQNAHFTTGTGSSQPRGIQAVPSTVTAAATGAVTFDEVLDLKHSVDPAYRASAQFMFNDATLAAIKKLSVGSSDARPLWQPSVIVGEPSTVDGDTYIVNQDVASMAASAKAIYYGDMSHYWIRDVTGIRMLRLVERYADYLQVGFLAFMRSDGDYVDPGTDPIKHLAMAAS